MPWSTTRTPGTAAKYRTKAHLDKCAEYKRDLKRYGYLTCAAVVCVMPTRTITNPNGRDRDGLTAGHDDDGVTYRGPEHRACNVKDGARRGNRRSRGMRDVPKRLRL